jgi:hypothetical protein
MSSSSPPEAFSSEQPNQGLAPPPPPENAGMAPPPPPESSGIVAPPPPTAESTSVICQSHGMGAPPPPPFAVNACDVIVFDANAQTGSLRHVVCIARDAQWETGAIIFFDTAQCAMLSEGRVMGMIASVASSEFPLGAGYALPLDAIAGLEVQETENNGNPVFLVAIQLHKEIRAFFSAPQITLHLFFSSEVQANEWMEEVKSIWPNPFFSNTAEGACLGILTIFMCLQFIPIIGPFFSIPIMLWNCYVARKEMRQAVASGKKDCCTSFCTVVCCLSPKRGVTAGSTAVAGSSAIATKNPLSSGMDKV